MIIEQPLKWQFYDAVINVLTSLMGVSEVVVNVSNATTTGGSLSLEINQSQSLNIKQDLLQGKDIIDSNFFSKIC